MMQTVKIILFGLIGAISLDSCSDAQNFDVVPTISYVGLSKINFNQSQSEIDTLVLFLTFTDGNGDLGESIDLGKDIELIDSRTPDQPEFLSLPMVPEMGASGGISGDLQVLKQLIPAFDLCCILPNGRICEVLDTYPVDTLHYSIRIRDRAGNWSNTVVTDDIYITCD